MTLKEQFGDIDIYLFDQLLKGRFDACKRVIDWGCGEGRNLVYFLQQGFEVYGVDQNPEAIARTRELAAQLAPELPPENFVVGKIESAPFKNQTFDVAICNAVLHFAQNEEHFEQMLFTIWRSLNPGGFLLCRLATDIGIENLVVPLGAGRYLLPDGSERYLVNKDCLLGYTKRLNGVLFEYIKTTNVQSLRSMTTWCVRKT